MNNIYIALGSNLKNPKKQIKDGIQSIKKIDGVQILSKSKLYETPPVGILDQPNFVNAVIKIDSDLSPNKLLEELLNIENNAARVRIDKNGPRTLDLDILLFNDLILDKKNLIIPHPRMHERLFVLIPLKDIDETIVIPNHGAIIDIINRLTPEKIIRIE
ncbi:2-amino-4-hydroxy-6-hydroxymethyldihydropteridine diphosphokinase [Methylophilaceae bacterium]|jgi:2-amino-4-hydroxy-6-hydroxymethyldihydropteridine diphosphokinase|nr:2-amino-4-hydroxy-6-hydroxymethyldihydropteridine diphosphokinase [Methylophilaceae bacterium]|tara:strand:+ start:1170 stop:1649 length:480 start_codon:yes stop_codon:yes gene_type:complete